MNWKQIPLGPLQTNCYVLFNHQREAVIFDPGGDAHVLKSWLSKNDITPAAILLTHAHFDHIGAVSDIRQTYNIDVYIHEKEQDWLTDPGKNGSIHFLPDSPIQTEPADHLLQGNSSLNVGGFTLDMYETPGHSPGSISFYHKETEVVFSGDVLFSGSIGRTDLPGGNHQTLLTSIHQTLLELPENTTVACGHGPVTSIEAEMDSNPFLNGFS
ncbi:Glyoxylase, beta-lactamase superfamily II [Alteribacillus persepolensis]|uniref:Glyoxylase, beta-lactamase superfamily II n=1 Tax=Alteribacillus persepolensis TaxID=568899 RepID=A0A1G8CZ18_9BACI|nr:MBL fold metallo-hydrolase [Alteribacillus persepolensis]SDH50170.1 Glyoxylase, beta-lactamase superfamily II [Alteribacillus persepolensis]